jgi:hypothetical protein
MPTRDEMMRWLRGDPIEGMPGNGEPGTDHVHTLLFTGGRYICGVCEKVLTEDDLSQLEEYKPLKWTPVKSSDGRTMSSDEDERILTTVEDEIERAVAKRMFEDVDKSFTSIKKPRCGAVIAPLLPSGPRKCVLEEGHPGGCRP